jgi:hypothetical protein
MPRQPQGHRPGRPAAAAAALGLNEISPEALASVREVEKRARKLTLMELTERTCKWPIGDPATDEFWFCGLPSAGKGRVPGKPYCEAHVGVAFQPMSGARRDRSRSSPALRATAISGGWSISFMVLGPLLLLSGLAARKGAETEGKTPEATAARAAPGLRTLGYWAFLAFLPSSLMLCVTSKISTDLGSFPLVWVIPLALYLLTFVLVFSTRSPLSADRLRRVLPLAMAVLVFFSLRPTATLAWIALFLLAFFVVSLLAHRMLFEARPDARQLTVFYLTMSVGGALGGLFNSIFAPLFFDRLLEYPITVALIALLMIRRPSPNAPREVAIGLALAMVALCPMLLDIMALHRLGPVVKTMLAVAVLMAIYAGFRKKPLVPATATVTMVTIWALFGTANILMIDRSFFGVHLISVRGDIREYKNGTTVHGAQLISESGDRPTPLTYYHPEGPMAQIVNDTRKTPARTIGSSAWGPGRFPATARPGRTGTTTK